MPILVLLSILNDLQIAPYLVLVFFLFILSVNLIRIEPKDFYLIIIFNILSLLPLLNNTDPLKLFLSNCKLNLILLLFSIELEIKKNQLSTYLTYKFFSFSLSNKMLYTLWFGFFVLAWFNSADLDTGLFNIPRFNGIGYDPNLVAAAIVFFILHSNKSSNLAKLTLVLTQSITNLTALILHKLNLSRYSSILLITSTAYLIVMDGNFEFITNDGFFDERYNSLLLRMTSWSRAIDALSLDMNHLLFGIGTGQSYSVSEIVFHNFFIQTIYDRGLIFSIPFFTFLLIKFNLLMGKEKMLTLLVPMFLLDPIWTLIFPAAFFICRNKLNLSNNL